MKYRHFSNYFSHIQSKFRIYSFICMHGTLSILHKIPEFFWRKMARNCHKSISSTQKKNTDANKLARLLNNRQPNWFIDIQLARTIQILKLRTARTKSVHILNELHTIFQHSYRWQCERIQNAWRWCASQIMWEMCNRSYQALITKKYPKNLEFGHFFPH